MKDIIEQIREATQRYIMPHGRPPTTIYLGSENYAHYQNHPLIHEARRYARASEPRAHYYGKTTFEGVEILCVLNDPLHLRAVGEGEEARAQSGAGSANE